MGEQSLHEHPSCRLLRVMIRSLTAPLIIGIAGDSGSGKTNFSAGIRQLLGEDVVQTIGADGYHKENRKEREKSGRLPLDPDANHLNLLLSHVKELKQGHRIEVPIYNHITGDFDIPRLVSPSPIIIVEGLHVLYPQFLPFLDFTIFCDPDRKVKRQWKKERDMKKRGHEAERLEREMIVREAAYKRWIDFQKTSATVVIKISHSALRQITQYDFKSTLPEHCYKVELLLEPSAHPLPSVVMPLDIARFLDRKHPPFYLSSVLCQYWGREVINIQIDGVLSEEAITPLKDQIVACTGIPVAELFPSDASFSQKRREQITATEFTQLLIAWRFVEFLTAKNKKEEKRQ